MTQFEDEINAKFAAMEKRMEGRMELLEIENRGLKVRLQLHGDWLTSIDSRMPLPRRSVKRFPVKYSKIYAQLFYNAPNTSGQHGGDHSPLWQLKVEFHTEKFVETLKIPMKAPNETEAKRPDSMLAANAEVSTANLIGSPWIGGTKKGVVGSEKTEDNVATIWWDDSEVDYPHHVLFLGSIDWPGHLSFEKQPWIRGNNENEKKPKFTWTWTPDEPK